MANGLPVEYEEAKRLPDRYSSDEARSIIDQPYSEKVDLGLNDGSYISGSKAAAKIPHAKELNINPEDYGFSNKEVKLLQKFGLVDYIKKGYTLPPTDLVLDIQNAVKNLAGDSSTKELDDKTYTYNGKIPVKILQNSERSSSGKSVSIIVINKETNDIVTIGKRKLAFVNKVQKTGNM